MSEEITVPTDDAAAEPASWQRPCFAVVTGGGTAGHVLPALAIMDRLVERGRHPDELHYIGTSRGVERRLLPDTGYSFTMYDVVGLQRSLSTRNLLFVPKMIRSVWSARKLLGRLRPSVVVNVGGYASFPATLAARLRRIPIVVISYDRLPGLVSRLTSRFANASAVAFDGVALPRAVPTGAPVRPEIIAVDRACDRASARALLDLPDDRFVIAVFGGSLGAKAINEAVAGLVDLAADRRDVAVHHVVGDRWLEQAPSPRDGADGIMYHVVGYEDRMTAVYAAADLLVTRAGASTIAELSTTGSAGVIVPWPGAAEDHQVENAKTLSERGAAVMLSESELGPARLLAEIDRLIGDPRALDAIRTSAHVLGERHRSTSLIELIETTARRS